MGFIKENLKSVSVGLTVGALGFSFGYGAGYLDAEPILQRAKQAEACAHKIGHVAFKGQLPSDCYVQPNPGDLNEFGSLNQDFVLSSATQATRFAAVENEAGHKDESAAAIEFMEAAIAGWIIFKLAKGYIDNKQEKTD